MLFFKKSKTNEEVKPYGEMQQDFYFIVEETFGPLDTGGIIVVGTTCNSPVYKDTEVEILTEERRIPTKILGLETYKKLQWAVEKDTNVGMLLEGMTKCQVKPGDLIVLPGEGCVDNTIAGLVAILKKKEGKQPAIQGGQMVTLKFFKEGYEAKITYERIERESEDRELVRFVALAESKIPYSNKEVVRVCDEEGELIGIGRVFDLK